MQTPADDSDYGSDFSPEEVEIVNSLLSGNLAQIEIAEDNLNINDVEYNKTQGTARILLPRGGTIESPGSVAISDVGMANANLRKFRQQGPLDGILPRSPLSEPRDVGRVSDFPNPSAPIDIRSPLERFRSPPKKALSVTDLVSPAWCELQYWYVLTVYGKTRPTPTMKAGTALHEKLEAEIYTTVKVELQTKEDVWGLRIWNFIQGLRTLEEIGQTRELSIFGVVDGEVVNGVIDELSFICPDTKLEAELDNYDKSDSNQLPQGSTMMSDQYKEVESQSSKLYICDVKTRASGSLPVKATFRPTEIQLMLYHRILGDLVSDTTDFSLILKRFNLNGDNPFSDAFIAQIGNINQIELEFASQQSSSEQDASSIVIEAPTSQDSVTVLLEHNSLNALWRLMIEHLQRLLPYGRASIGNVLKAEYRNRGSGHVIGVKTIPMNDQRLDEYLTSGLGWWRGEREARGVEIEEAWKCGSCDFAENCEWRLDKVAGRGQSGKSRQPSKALEP